MPTATLEWLDADLEEKTQECGYNQTQDEELPELKEEYTPEQESQVRIFAADFLGDVKALVKQYMEYFFRDKMLHCGGKIPRTLLFSERRMAIVLNYDIIKAVDRAYAALEPLLPDEEVEQSKRTGEATSDIRLVNETLRLMARSGIPQQFAGGMMLMYLEFVEGVNIGSQS